MSTLATRICRQCGIEFMGGPRAWYCPNCRRERAKESSRRNKQKIRTNGQSDRPLGSIDKCIVCGAEYVVQAARQKYCKMCAPEAIKAVDREQGRNWLKEAVKKHGEEYLELHCIRKQLWEKNNKKDKICPICGEKLGPGMKIYCSPQCKNAGKRYRYAKYAYKAGIAKTEPKISDYMKGGRLYDRNKRS